MRVDELDEIERRALMGSPPPQVPETLGWEAVSDAAAEHDRLCNEIQGTLQQTEGQPAGKFFADMVVADLAAERDRLREEIHRLRQRDDEMRPIVDGLRLEIEVRKRGAAVEKEREDALADVLKLLVRESSAPVRVHCPFCQWRAPKHHASCCIPAAESALRKVGR